MKLFNTKAAALVGSIVLCALTACGGGGSSSASTASSAIAPTSTPAPPAPWSLAKSLLTARQGHTATLLADGRVLVAGGERLDDSHNITQLSSAEIYDPTANAWAPAGSMGVQVTGYTATLLANGKVLIAGGITDLSLGTATTTVQLYNPSTNSWSTASSMHDPRAYHTATLLPNGKVLVAGGMGSTIGVTSHVELYDPDTDTWSNAGLLLSARYRSTATLLPSGKILMLGGGGYMPFPEIYDPTTNTSVWAATPPAVLVDPSAILLTNGRVLVVAEPTLANQPATALLYDPSANTWTSAGTLSAQHGGHTATLLPNGTVLVAGGAVDTVADGTHDVLIGTSVTEVYDPVANTWTTSSKLIQGPVMLHTVTLLNNGMVLVAGGTTAQDDNPPPSIAAVSLYTY